MRSEYRPCIVTVRGSRKLTGGTLNHTEYTGIPDETHNALFHCWSERFWTVGESPMVGGCAAGQMSQVVAIVEYGDGTIHEHYPSEIRFMDGKAKYCFAENNKKKPEQKIYGTARENIYYLHDRPNLEESKNIWKMSNKEIGLSTNGGDAWKTLDDLAYESIYGNTFTKDKSN